MHGLIKERLEEYLRGAPGKKIPLQFEEHLRECEECRDELALMQDQSQLLKVLSVSRELDPAPGFYARVMERVEAQQGSSIWNVFLDPAFGRRVIATSLALAGLLVGYLAFAEKENAPQPPNAETIMAVQEHPSGLGQDRQRDRDTILVTLATYKD